MTGRKAVTLGDQSRHRVVSSRLRPVAYTSKMSATAAKMVELRGVLLVHNMLSGSVGDLIDLESLEHLDEVVTRCIDA